MSSISSTFRVSVTLLPTDQGGRAKALVGERFGCPCKFHPDDLTAWDCRIHLGGMTLSPGETAIFDVQFMTEEAGALCRTVSKFYLWEGRIIGEATARI